MVAPEERTVERWFLSAEDRGNPATAIDRRRHDGLGWTEGNTVRLLVHGAEYFPRLHAEVSPLGAGDHVWFTDWRGDAGQRLAGEGTELGTVFTDAARRGVDVRGLIWRSHPDQEGYAEQENAHVGKVLNEAGGEVIPDERVRRFGSHHQKLVVIRRPSQPDRDVAFVGGIDLCHGRGDDARHEGDPQAIQLDERYGPRPAWHDVQAEIRGPAVGDVAHTFAERWTDPTPPDHRNPWRIMLQRDIRQPKTPTPLPTLPDPPSSGTMAVQVLRTYPAKRPRYPFAPRGERSVARAYQRALRRARSLIYVEDQYLWSRDVARFFADALRRSAGLRLIAVVPRYPDRNGPVSGPLNRIGQHDALAIVLEAGEGRVAIFDLENERGMPIYVHGKLCVIDDVWVAVGSDNLNRRSWTHDSEIACAVLDRERDERPPEDPGAQGDGARRLPRELRLALWREHLGAGPSDDELLDPAAGFDAWRRSAEALDAWHANGRKGPRPAGRVRAHRPLAVSGWAKWWAGPLYRVAVDPDGRPFSDRRRDTY